MTHGDQVARAVIANHHRWKAILVDSLPDFGSDYSPFTCLWLVKLCDLPYNM